MKNLILFIGLISILFFACHKDETSIVEEVSTTFTAKVYEEISGTVMGYVYDEANNPVEGATVAIYSASTKTNKLGAFVMRNVKMDKQGTYLKVVKSGYILGSDRVFPNKATVYSTVKLFKDKKDKSFDAVTGGTIAITDGGTISFPANAIRYENGGEYSGKVLATTKFIDPTSPSLQDEMPGDLYGLNAQGSNVILHTAGMFLVQLSSEKGELLNLKAGSKATFSLPSKIKEAPSTMPLWWFDENGGLWKEEGSAKLVNGNYEGEVSHFSFWNCDIQVPYINICGKVVDQFGNPMTNTYITVKITGKDSSLYRGYAHGNTDANGEFCGRIPKGYPLQFSIVSYSPCAIFNLIEEIPAQFQDISNKTFVVTVSGQKKIEGTLVCNGTPLTKGYCIFEQNGYIKILDIQNGNFSFNWFSLFCDNSKPINIIGVNDNTFTTSTTQSINYNSIPTSITLETCQTNCNLSATITGSCQGDASKITVTGGSGNYTYSWSNGSKTGSTILDDSSFVKVTVTDVGNLCSQVFVKTFSPKPDVRTYQSNCAAPTTLSIQTNNNNTINWFNGETGSTINVTSPGTYDVTVCNNNGCCEISKFVVNSIEPSVMYNNSSCNGNTYRLEGNFDEVFIYNWPNTLIYQPNQTLSVFETGYVYEARPKAQGCLGNYVGIQLPYYYNLKINNIIDTFDILLSNKVDYTLNGTSCNNCTVGPVGIYNINNLGTDIIAQNLTGLPSGEYYLFVKDAITGCIIAHRRFKVK